MGTLVLEYARTCKTVHVGSSDGVKCHPLFHGIKYANHGHAHPILACTEAQCAARCITYTGKE